MMILDHRTSDINAATCGCPAGKGPVASCKHVGAFAMLLLSFVLQENCLVF